MYSSPTSYGGSAAYTAGPLTPPPLPPSYVSIPSPGGGGGGGGGGGVTRRMSPSRLRSDAPPPQQQPPQSQWQAGVHAVSISPPVPARSPFVERSGSQLSPRPAAAPLPPQTPQRSLILAAAQRHWGNPDGLPDVVREVQTSLGLSRPEDAIPVIEATLGSPLPLDLVSRCAERFGAEATRPKCANGLLCPFVGDRTHLDRYMHPCPVHSDGGFCAMQDNRTHAAFFSHDGSDANAGPASPGQGPVRWSEHPPPAAPAAVAESPRLSRGAPRHMTSVSTPARKPASPARAPPSPSRSPVAPASSARGGSAARSVGSLGGGGTSSAWESYLSLLKRRDVAGLVARHYDSRSNVQVTNKNEYNFLTEYNGEGGAKKYCTYVTRRLTRPEGLTITWIDAHENGPVRVTWACTGCGFRSVKEIIVFGEDGVVLKQRVLLDYERPDATTKQPSVFRQQPVAPPVERPPPEPFSSDPRLRGKPLTPAKSPPRDRPHSGSCTRGMCPRLSSPPARQSGRQPYQTCVVDSFAPKPSKATPTPASRTPRTASPRASRATPQQQRAAAGRTPLQKTSARQAAAATAASEAEADRIEMEAAATRIQASFKGRQTRQQLQEEKEQAHAATRIQASFRGKKARQEVEDRKEMEAAATKIQASFKGRQTRQQLQEEKEQAHAATRIQASFRGKKARQEVEDRKEMEAAATKIQASFKGRKTRQQLQDEKEQAHAATKIQASFRGKKVRKQMAA